MLYILVKLCNKICKNSIRKIEMQSKRSGTNQNDAEQIKMNQNEMESDYLPVYVLDMKNLQL